MATTKIDQKPVGSIVKLLENGVATEYIIVHQGNPSAAYDASCNGTWVLRKEILEMNKWDSSNDNRYKTSFIHEKLNSTTLALFDAKTQSIMKQVKIPYCEGYGNSGSVQWGSSGLSCRIFLLSIYEVGADYIDHLEVVDDGNKLDYFISSSTDFVAAKERRIAYFEGGDKAWYSRTPSSEDSYCAAWINYDGDVSDSSNVRNTKGIRPAMVLSNTVSVDDFGNLVWNTPPVISGSTLSGSDLGTKEEGFDFTYTVSDVDGDAVTVKEYLDNVVKRSYTPALGQENTFEAVAAANWQKVLNGSHTLKVVANDGKADSAPYTVTFSRAVYEASITLTEPLDADASITVAVLNLTGSIPEDATLQVLLTNNAKDLQPVWEDATSSVKNGSNYVFANQVATNGFAFNFQVTVSRGPSGQGGHISNIGGAFQ